MSLSEWFTGTAEEKVVMAKAQELKDKKKLVGRRDIRTSSEGSTLQSQFTRRQILSAFGGAAILGAGVAIGLPSQEKSTSSVAMPQSPQPNSESADSVLKDGITPETGAQIKLPEFSIKEIQYKPQAPEGLDMTPARFQEVSKSFSDSLEKNFPQFKKDFAGADGSQAKSQLVTSHIIKYFDHLLSLDPKISAHANSKSMGTFNERCSYMTLFLIGQGRYIGVVNPDPDRPYPKLFYGKSQIREQMEIGYKGQNVRLPIIEIDAQANDIPRAWYDSNNKMMVYSPAQALIDAQAMVGTELNSEQVAEFADVLRVSTLKHEGTHVLMHYIFPKSTTQASLRSGHRVILEKIRTHSGQKDSRRTFVQGIEISELTAVGVEIANFRKFPKLYLAKMLPQPFFSPDQYQQAYIHFLTYLANRKTIPLHLRLKVQTFLIKFPRADAHIISEVMMDPLLPEVELAEIGKQLFETGLKIFEKIEHE